MSGKVNQVIFQEGLDDEFRHKYSYDGDNKLTQVHTSLDGIYWTLEAKYFYYAHGPLARVEIGEHNIQGVDYYYTLQGWIKGVNSPEGTFGKDGTEDNPSFNTDEFAYSLHYFEGDYTARGTSANPNNSIFGSAFNTDEDYSLFTGFYDHTEPSGNSVNGIPLADSYDRKSLYNGNVAAMTTSIAHFGRQEDGNGRATQSMNYRYDQLHRIAAASSKQWNPTTGVWESQTLGKAYQTSYQYDRNGNIQKLFRRNQAGDVIDNLKYSYDPVKKNQLYRVADQATGSAAQEGLEGSNHLYEYDEIGNLIKNGSDGIQTIIWNIQGKVEKVVRNTATITYRYDASGNRITKQVATTTTHHINYYLRDVSGNVMAIYEYDKKPENTHQATIQLKEIPIYGGTRLGQYRTSYSTIEVDGTPTRIKDKPTALGQRVYEFSNHLQNVLVVLADFKVPVTDGTTTEFKAIVVSANDYYPFGMVMEGRKYYDPNYDYRYGFNGKEDDKDFGDKQLIQDYGFRLYNPAIARFLSVDPLAPSYPWNSVYAFAEGDVISCIDLDGLERTKTTYYWVNSAFIGHRIHEINTAYELDYFKQKNLVSYMFGKSTQPFSQISDMPYLASQRAGFVPFDWNLSPVTTNIEYEGQGEVTSYRYHITYFTWENKYNHKEGLKMQPSISFEFNQLDPFTEWGIEKDWNLSTKLTTVGAAGYFRVLNQTIQYDWRFMVNGAREDEGTFQDFITLSEDNSPMSFILPIEFGAKLIIDYSELNRSKRYWNTLPGFSYGRGGGYLMFGGGQSFNLNDNGTMGDQYQSYELSLSLGGKSLIPLNISGGTSVGTTIEGFLTPNSGSSKTFESFDDLLKKRAIPKPLGGL